MAQNGMLTLSDSPQYFDRPTTVRLIASVIICLVPAALWGVYAFGLPALAVLLVAIACAEAGEWLMRRIRSQNLPRDGHALLTGLLIGMVMPPAIPLWVPAAASLFAILLVKWPLGGIGSTWIHPAAAGWAFAAISWPQLMNRFSLPDFFRGPIFSLKNSHDAFGAISGWFANNPANGMGPSDILAAQAFYRSPFDTTLTDLVNRFVLSPFGANLPGSYVDSLLGTSVGAIGEISAILLMLGSVVLIARGIVSWHAPASFFGSFAVLTYIFGALPYGGGFFSGDVLFMCLRGSFLLVLFFVATDISTGPLSYKGRCLFGLGLGLVCFLIQFIGRGVDAALVAVLVMNMLTGSIDRLCRTRRPEVRS